MKHLNLILDFWRVYDRLDHEGRCDSPGGMESRRVFGEWLDAGMPSRIGDFIVARAHGQPFEPR